MGSVPQGIVGARMVGGSAFRSEVPGGTTIAPGSSGVTNPVSSVHSCLGLPTVRHCPSIGGGWSMRPSLCASELPMQSHCSETRLPQSTAISFA
jgi:hypothetical protein